MVQKNEKLQQFEEYIANKNIAIVGLELSSMGIIDYFCNNKANVTVFDKRNIDEMENVILNKITDRCVKFSFGENTLINLVGFDIVFKSSKCEQDLPEVRAEGLRGAVVTSERELLLSLCPGKIIGVTGGDGLTTTAELIYDILKEDRNDCYLLSNSPSIESVLDKLDRMTYKSVVVVEFNEQQLKHIQLSPEIAVIINEAYLETANKEENDDRFENIKNIFAYQSESEKLVLDYNGIIYKNFSAEIPGKVQYYSTDTKLDNGVIFDNNILKYCEDGVRRHIVTIDDAISVYEKEFVRIICAATSATYGLVDPDIQARAIIKYRKHV